jgi:hypothetical protein
MIWARSACQNIKSALTIAKSVKPKIDQKAGRHFFSLIHASFFIV